MPSGEPTLLQQRRISGKGTLQIPFPPSNVRRGFVLETRVIRKPVNEYKNVGYNPAKSRYANINVMRGGSVIQEIHVEYVQQAFNFFADSSGQNLYATQCMYEGILESFANLGEALGLNVISVVNNIKTWKSMDLLWDEILVCCYADTAIDLYLFQYEYDVCPDNVSVPQRLGYGIPSLVPIAPGTPLQGENGVSPPYDSSTNDNGNTAPYSTDVIEPCTTVIFGAGLNNLSCGKLGADANYTFNGYAELKPVNVPPNGCSGLQLYLDGVNQGGGQVFHPTAVIVSRSGNCTIPNNE